MGRVRESEGTACAQLSANMAHHAKYHSALAEGAPEVPILSVPAGRPVLLDKIGNPRFLELVAARHRLDVLAPQSAWCRDTLRGLDLEARVH